MPGEDGGGAGGWGKGYEGGEGKEGRGRGGGGEGEEGRAEGGAGQAAERIAEGECLGSKVLRERQGPKVLSCSSPWLCCVWVSLPRTLLAVSGGAS